MTEFDKEYLKLVRKILDEGVEVENRTGVNTIKIPQYTFEFDLRKEDPILTVKQFYARQAITEMLWIWQMGSNDVRELHKRNVHIWDEWMVDEDGIYRIYEPETKEEDFDKDKEVEVLDPLSTPVSDPFGLSHKLEAKKDNNGNILKAKSLIPGRNIKMAKYYGKEFAHTIGTAYGYIVKKYDFIGTLIKSLKNYPTTDRRKVRSLWQDDYLRTAVLPSCVWSTEWGVTGDNLNLMVHQRSCDVPLGLPFNITQYACLLKMIAKVTGLKASTISYSINDPHIYVNQIEGMKELIRREDKYNELSKKNKDKLISLKKEYEKEILNIKKDSLEYKIIDSNIKIIDIILNPSKPYLWINPEINDFYKFDNSKDMKDVKIENYKHMGSVSFKVTQ